MYLSYLPLKIIKKNENYNLVINWILGFIFWLCSQTLFWFITDANYLSKWCSRASMSRQMSLHWVSSEITVVSIKNASIEKHYIRLGASIKHLLYKIRIQYQVAHPELRSYTCTCTFIGGVVYSRKYTLSPLYWCV